MARSLMRKFREVKKKDGVPVKYTAGAANPEARRAELEVMSTQSVHSIIKPKSKSTYFSEKSQIKKFPSKNSQL